MENELKLYVIMRADIEIPLGKAAAQAGHAFVDVLERCSPELRASYINSAARPKISLKAKNLHAIERAVRECSMAGIPYAVIVDAGRTVFPEPTLTCMGVGPVTFEALPKYLRGLQLL